MSWQHRIRQLEVVRESGKTAGALAGLCAIRSEASAEGNNEGVALATAHIIVCYKHLYQNTGNKTYLFELEHELKRGLALPVPAHFKAVFWMRFSDLECERKDYGQADLCCQQAYSSIDRGTPAESECLGRWAYVKTMLGELAAAESLFTRATNIIGRTKGARTFERVTLECGLMARRIQLCLAQRRYIRAAACFIHGYALAWEYRLRYGMPQRVRQYHRAIYGSVAALLKFKEHR